MYTKGEREGILWEFHRSGMSVAEACRRLPLARRPAELALAGTQPLSGRGADRGLTDINVAPA